MTQQAQQINWPALTRDALGIVGKLWKFNVRRIILPLIQLDKAGKIRGDRQRAIIECFGREQCWLFTIKGLRDLQHYQAVLVGARSMLEINLDIRILANDKTGKRAKRYYAFDEIERLRAGTSYYNYATDNKGIPGVEPPEQDIARYVNSQRAKDKAIRRKAKLWGGTDTDINGKPFPLLVGNRIVHWSGIGKFADRAGRLHSMAYRTRIETSHSILSWHVHAGSTGSPLINDPRQIQIFWAGLGYTARSARESAIVLIDTFKLSKNDPKIITDLGAILPPDTP